MFTLVNINTLEVLVLKCLVILYGHKCSGIVANVVTPGYSVIFNVVIFVMWQMYATE